MSVAVASAGASLATSLIKAKQAKKDRVSAAKAKVGDAVMEGAEKKSKALQNIVGNLRASLLKG